MTDPIDEERSARRKREGAVLGLAAADRRLRRARIVSAVLITAATINLLFMFLATDPTNNGLALAACALVAAYNITMTTPRARNCVDAWRRDFQHAQREYDAAFARMIAAEPDYDPVESVRALERLAAEMDRPVERALAGGIAWPLFHCPVCAAPGHRAGPDAHDVTVPSGHERQIIGDNETWIVCHERGKPRRWRYDPLA